MSDRILVAAPKPLELESWKEHLENPVLSANGAILHGSIGSAEIVVALTGKGEAQTAAALTALLPRWRPRYVLLVGIAGGLGKVHKGDVVVASFVYSLDFGKVESGNFRPRPEINCQPDKRLLDIATILAESSEEQWTQYIHCARPTRGRGARVKAYVGYCGSSEKVIDDPNYPVVIDFLKTAPEVLAVEMEAIGANTAVRQVGMDECPGLGMLMIRGISDELGASAKRAGAGRSGRAKWSAYAADTAAAFAHSLIRTLYPPLPAAPSGRAEDEAGGTQRDAEQAAALAAYERIRADLVSLAIHQRALVSELASNVATPSAAQSVELFDTIIGRIESDLLRVVVAGRFNSGKTTILNALIGERLLPTSYVPTTAFRCEIRYADADDRRALLYPRPTASIATVVPLRLDLDNLRDELNRHVRIPLDDIGPTPYSKLELYWPVELCRRGVALVDTTGLENPDLEISLPEIAIADAVIYGVNGINGCTAKDLGIIKVLREFGASIVFVITHYDAVQSAVSRGEIVIGEYRESIESMLRASAGPAARAVIFVDAQGALLAKLSADSAAMQQSGILELETTLRALLVRGAGATRTVTLIRSLRAATANVLSAIETRKSLWQQSQSAMTRRHSEIEQALHELDRQRSLIASLLDAEIRNIGHQARELAATYYEQLWSELPAWVDAYTVKTNFGLFPKAETVREAVGEIRQYVTNRIQEDVVRWTETTLKPMISQRLMIVERSIAEGYGAFLASIDHLRRYASVDAAASPSIAHAPVVGRMTTLTEDALAAQLTNALALGTITGAVAIQIAASATLTTFVFLNPLAIAVAVIALIVGGQLPGRGVPRLIKSKVTEHAVSTLSARRGELADVAQNQVLADLRAREAEVAGLLVAEMNSVETAIHSVLEQLRSNVDAEQELMRLDRVHAETREVVARLDELGAETQTLRSDQRPLH